MLKKMHFLCYNCDMKTVVYTTPHIEDCAELLFSLLKKRDTAHPGKLHAVIVPDRYTQTFERRLFESLGIAGTFNTEILSFSRLLLRLQGVTGERYLLRQCGVMAVRKLLGEHGDKLPSFKRSVASKNFAERMYDLLISLKSAGFDFRADSRGVTNARLRQRLDDICFIFERYSEFLSGGWRDGCDMLAELSELISGGALDGAEVFVAGFELFSAQEKSALAAMAGRGLSLHILCSAHSVEYPAAGDALASVLLTLEECGAKYTVEERAPSEKQASPARLYFENITSASFPSPASQACGGSITAYHAGSRDDEAKYIAESIRLLTIGEDYRYSDIFVTLSDPQLAEPLRRAFAEFEIPCFFDDKLSVLSHAAAQYTLGCIALFSRSLGREYVFRLVKNIFFEGERADKDCFENYCLKYGTDRTGFLRPFENNDALTPAAERIRQTLEKVYTALSLPSSAPAAGYAQKLSAFISESELPQAAEKYRERLAEQNEAAYAEFTRQTGSAILRILSDIEAVFGQTKLKTAELYELFESGAGALMLSASPPEIDSVQAGDLRSAMFAGGKCVFVAGTDAGFPPLPPAGGILSDADIEELDRYGIKLGLGSGVLDERARHGAASLACSRFERFTYSAVTSGGTCFPDVLSAYFRTFKDLNTLSRQSIRTNEISCKEGRAAYLSALKHTARSAVHSLLESVSLRRSGETVNTRLLDAHYSALSAKGFKELILGSLYGRKAVSDGGDFTGLYFGGGKTSVSVIECFYECPFKHFARYGLRAREREQAEIKAPDIGNFLHRAAELYIREEAYLGSAAEAAADITARIAEEKEFVRYFEGESGSLLLKKLERECVRFFEALSSQLENSDFVPAYTEAVFGEGGDFPPIEIEGLDLKISGKVDRLDVCEIGGRKFARIIDYKSGSKEYSESDVKLGISLQLYIYLYALTEAGGYLAGGVYYFPISDKFTPENGEPPYRMRGVTLSDLSVIYASDRNLRAQTESDSLPVKLDLRGDAPKIATRTKVKSQEEFDCAMKSCLSSAVTAHERILTGEREIFPVRGVCAFCEYIRICENYEGLNVRKLTSDGAGKEDEE